MNLRRPHRAYPRAKDHRRSIPDYGPCIAAKAPRSCPLWVISVGPTRQRLRPMSALPPKADKRADVTICPLSAKSGLMHRKKSALRELSHRQLASHVGGSRPSAPPHFISGAQPTFAVRRPNRDPVLEKTNIENAAMSAAPSIHQR